MKQQKKKVAINEERAERYAKLCNLVETLWHTENLKPDFDNLLPLTSPEARRVANYIEGLFEAQY